MSVIGTRRIGIAKAEIIVADLAPMRFACVKTRRGGRWRIRNCGRERERHENREKEKLEMTCHSINMLVVLRVNNIIL